MRHNLYTAQCLTPKFVVCIVASPKRLAVSLAVATGAAAVTTDMLMLVVQRRCGCVAHASLSAVVLQCGIHFRRSEAMHGRKHVLARRTSLGTLSCLFHHLLFVLA